MSSEYSSDQLLESFRPLWRDLCGVGNGVLLAGGYGLFLKQRWLQENLGVRSLVPLESWKEGRPRVTMDIDLIIHLDMIASNTDQHNIQSVLDKHKYVVVPGNERWQYEMQTAGMRKIVVDFHAPPPRLKRDDIDIVSRRVKPLPSMKGHGIHGRLNPEAICSDLMPFRFSICDLEIVMPDTLTMVVMKLVAMRDRWQSSQEEGADYQRVTFQRDQAIKHGRDVLRAVAMLTREENDNLDNIVYEMRSFPVFSDAADIYNDLFTNDNFMPLLSLESYWESEHIEDIKAFLKKSLF